MYEMQNERRKIGRNIYCTMELPGVYGRLVVSVLINVFIDFIIIDFISTYNRL